jgi:hypothetical protein
MEGVKWKGSDGRGEVEEFTWKSVGVEGCGMEGLGRKGLCDSVEVEGFGWKDSCGIVLEWKDVG